MVASPIDLLAELVAIPSHASYPEGLRRVADRIGTELADIGFERIAAEPAERRAPAWAESVLSPEVPFDALVDPVVWHRPGSLEGTLLLLGDLDAALAVDRPELVVRGERATGPAVADMKGGLVVLVEALRQLGSRSAPSITVVLSGDEQAGSLRSASTIAKHAATASWCLCLECAREGGKVMRSRAQVGVGQLAAFGTEAYAGTAASAADNPINLLARGLSKIARLPDRRPEVAVTATILRAGRRRSLIPREAIAILDARTRDQAAWEQAESELSSALRTLGAGGRLQLDLYAHRQSVPATERTAWLLSLVRRVGGELGIHIDATDSLAAGSSSFADSNRIPVLDGMGPSGGNLMTDDEYIELSSLDERSRVLAATIEALGAE
jgi:glutamate carboxypeptidase